MHRYPQFRQTVVDAADVRASAEFYRRLLDLKYRPGDEPPHNGEDTADRLVLVRPDGSRVLAFQYSPEVVPSTWPEAGVPMQLHLDFTVADREQLEYHRIRVEALGGAMVADRTDDPDESLYVFTDLDGHPFCIFVG